MARLPFVILQPVKGIVPRCNGYILVSVKELTDINTKKFAIQLNYQKYRRFFN
jgi:hypothetical protein